MSNQSVSFPKKYVINLCVGLAIMFLFPLMPPMEPLTTMGMKIIGIFIGSVYLWCSVDIIWPSILSLLALTSIGYLTSSEMLKLAFGDGTVNFILFSMVFFGAFQDAGVSKYICNWFLTRKIINGRPLVFCFLFIFASYFLSIFASPLASLLIFWPIIYEVFAELGYEKTDKFVPLMTFGVFYGAVLGQAAIPIRGGVLLMLSTFEKVSGLPVPYLGFMLFNFITSTILIFLYVILIKYIFRPDLTRLSSINNTMFNKENLPPISLKQKVISITMLLFITAVIGANLLPAQWAAAVFLKRIGMTGIAFFFIILLCVLRIDGEPVMTFKTMIKKHVSWDVYFLVAAATVLAKGLTDDQTGVKQWLVQLLQPLFGNGSIFFFSLVMLIFAVVTTNFANNGVMGVVIIPIICTFTNAMGFDPTAIVMVVAMILYIAVLTPSASPFAAMLHGNKEWISTKNIFIYGGTTVVVTFLFYVVVGIPLAYLLMGL